MCACVCVCVCERESERERHHLLEDQEMELCLASIKTVAPARGGRVACRRVDVCGRPYYGEQTHCYFRRRSFKENAAMRPSDALEA